MMANQSDGKQSAHHVNAGKDELELISLLRKTTKQDTSHHSTNSNIIKASAKKQSTNVNEQSRAQIDTSAVTSGGSLDLNNQAMLANCVPSLQDKFLKMIDIVEIASVSQQREEGAPQQAQGKQRAQVGNGKSSGSNQKQSGAKKSQKPRRRVATLAQRRAANIRERRRMFNLNSAFDRLRKKVPSFAYEKRLSRIETLKLAIMYIKFMDDLVNDDAYAEKYKKLTANTSTNSSASSGFLSSASYLSLYGHCAETSPSPPTTNHTLQTKGATSILTQQIGRQKTSESFAEQHQSPKRNVHQQSLKEGQTLLDKPIYGQQSRLSIVTNGFSRDRMQQNYQESQVNLCAQLKAQAPAQQYRGVASSQLKIPSPTNSTVANSIACCSSPAASSALSTCHSSTSTYTESPPISSPQIQQQQPATGHHSFEHIYYNNNNHHLPHAYNQTPTSQAMTNDESLISYYPTRAVCLPGAQQRDESKQIIYYNGQGELQSSEQESKSRGVALSTATNRTEQQHTPYAPHLHTLASSNNGEPAVAHQEHSSSIYQHPHLHSLQLHHHHQTMQQEQSQATTNCYTLHSLEAR